MNENELYQHFIITRFNIRANYSCKLRNPENNPMNRILDEDYLEDRFKIFEDYTLPSIKKQSNQNFTWIILFHKRTPNKFIERIKRLKEEYNFTDLYFDDEEKFNFSEYIDNQNLNSNYFITTRIDNDDMLKEDFIEQIQQYANNNLHECVLSFETGKKYDIRNQKEYLFKRKDNHFLSLIAPKNSNILQFNHAKIFESGKEIVMLESKNVMWTEVIHDSNVINKIKEEDIQINRNNTVNER